MDINLLVFAGYLCIWLAGCVLHIIWLRDKIESEAVKSALHVFFNSWSLLIPLSFYCVGIIYVS